MKFEGFSAEAFPLYDELRRNNSREWWPGNKDRYERFVREPLEALAAELEPEFGPIKTFRPFRDVRFSRDKTAPRGWSKGHPRIELLRRTSLVVGQDLPPPTAWMSTPESLHRVTLGWRHVKRWGDWLNANVGASTISVTDARGTARRGGTR